MPQNPENLIRIFLADDHAVVRQGTREMLNRHPLLNVVGECASGEELLPGLAEQRPDLLLLDINLPDRNGFALFQDVRTAFPNVKILFFSAHAEMQYVRKAKNLKAEGFLSKTIEEEALQAMVLSVFRTDDPPGFLSDISTDDPESNASVGKNPFTARETEILQQLARGLGNRDIARNLSLSVKTVDTHLANLMKKTGVNKRTQLLVLAYERGYL